MPVVLLSLRGVRSFLFVLFFFASKGLDCLLLKDFASLS